VNLRSDGIDVESVTVVDSGIYVFYGIESVHIKESTFSNSSVSVSGASLILVEENVVTNGAMGISNVTNSAKVANNLLIASNLSISADDINYAGNYLIAQNTIVDGPTLQFTGHADTDLFIQNNIIDVIASPFIKLNGFLQTSSLRNNLVGKTEGFWTSEENNFFLDPLFADRESADYHLLENSPAIDAGLNDLIRENYQFDLDGNPRINNEKVDLGAYERSTAALHPADANRDQSISREEFEAYNAAWRSNKAWSTAPEAIPVDFVTRAGYLLQKGGVYKNIGVGKPATWVPIDE
jgi:hypothetical protein